MSRAHLKEASLKKLWEIVKTVQFDIKAAEKLDNKTTYYGYIIERLESLIGKDDVSDLRVILAIGNITARMAAYYTVYETFLIYGLEGCKSEAISEVNELTALELGIDSSEEWFDEIKTICEAVEVSVVVHTAKLIIANFKVLDSDKNRNARMKRMIQRVEKDLEELTPYLKKSSVELNKILESLDYIDDVKYLDRKALIDICRDLTKRMLIDECKTGSERANKICKVFNLFK